MTAMTVQPTVKTTVIADYDPKYVYVATVPDAEFVADTAVTYVNRVYTPVTRAGGTAHALGVSDLRRIAITGAVSPGTDFIALVAWVNDVDSSATTSSSIITAKPLGADLYGWAVRLRTDHNSVGVYGGGSTLGTFSGATGIGIASGVDALKVLAVHFSGTTATAALNGVSLGSVSGLNPPGAWTQGLALGNGTGVATGTGPCSAILMGAVLGSTNGKTLEEITANPWLIFDDGVSGSASATFAATTEDATFSFNAKSGALASFNVTSADAVFAGWAVTGAASATFATATADTAFAGAATGDTSSGIITTPALKNNTGTILAGETGITAYIYHPTTGDLIVKKPSQTTNGSGVMTLADPLIASATQYRVVIVLGSGAEGMDKLTAA